MSGPWIRPRSRVRGSALSPIRWHGGGNGESDSCAVDSENRAGDLVLRLWTAADRATIDDIVASSRAEFDRWLPGMMRDLLDVEGFIEHVQRAAGQGTGWYYGVEVQGVVVGQCNINAREDETAEIGYWVRSDRTNEGIATRAVRALCGAAADHGFTSVVIRCDEGNERSAAVARKAGFMHICTLDLDPSLPRTSAQTGREMIWHLILYG
jgi:ribosomal-protein-serine acetyltransferase